MCTGSSRAGGSNLSQVVNLLSLQRALQPAPTPPAPSRRADSAARLNERQRRLAAQGLAGTNVTGGLGIIRESNIGRTTLLGQGGA